MNTGVGLGQHDSAVLNCPLSSAASDSQFALLGTLSGIYESDVTENNIGDINVGGTSFGANASAMVLPTVNPGSDTALGTISYAHTIDGNSTVGQGHFFAIGLKSAS
jgi:hypothetical protein